jgi:two-component sensor histidine kinase
MMASAKAWTVRSKLLLALSIVLLPVLGALAWLNAQVLPAGALLPAWVFIGAVVLALAIAWFIADILIAQPLRRLAYAARAYGGGQLAAHDCSELDALAETLTGLSARIGIREKELSQAIETREAMLREIHHRVKNNLQIVTSLLSLQAKSVQGENVQRAFSDVQTRVRALALVHRYLYESDDLQSVNLGAFLKELAASLQLSYGISQEQVEIAIDADEIWDVSDRAVPLALFMTDAMTNALKHAFPQGRRGVIRISLKSLPDSVVRFTVEDNGIGLADAQANAPEAQPGLGQPSLGMSLIKAFARQVDGKLTISGPPGTSVSIDFTNKLSAAH